MPTKTKPIVSPSSDVWGNKLNQHLEQLMPDDGGGINKFDKFSDRPNNLTADDKGKTYLYTQTGNFHQWTGTEWKVLNESVINVKDYGAVGDGVVDDTAAIQNLITKTGSFYKKDNVLNLIGAEIYFPNGKYLISDTLNLYPGTTLRGSIGGLLSSEPLPSTGSDFILSTKKLDGSPWENSAMFKITNGGPVAMFNLSFLGTQTVTNSVWLDAYDITSNYPGLTQGKFENCRVVGFTTAVISTKLFDTVFLKTGFEYNVTIFYLSGKDSDSLSLDTSYFSNCVFFGYYRGITLGNFGRFTRNNFSNCTFLSTDTNQTGIIAITNETSSNTVFSDNNFSSCIFETKDGNAINYFGGDNNIFSNNVFVSTNFHASSIVFQDSKSSVQNNILSGCVLKDSSVNMQYNADNLIFSNNSLIGNSNLNFSNVKNSQICNNSFANATNLTYDVNLNDICKNNIITGNIIKKVITIHQASTNNLNTNNLTII
jgi:hypothetical protein